MIRQNEVDIRRGQAGDIFRRRLHNLLRGRIGKIVIYDTTDGRRVSPYMLGRIV